MDGNQTNLVENLLKQAAQSRGLDKLAPAYVAAWAEVGCGVEKDANNPHFGNDYATLEAVLKKAKPIFAKHGLAIAQLPGRMSADGSRIAVTTVVIHTSGQLMQSEMELPIGSKATAQAAGSAITYARRYQLQAIAGVAPVDDDGEAASVPPPAPPKAKAPKEKKPAPAPQEKQPDPAPEGDETDQVLSAIEGMTLETMAKVQARVEELDDQEVAQVFLKKRRALKGKK